MKELFRSTDPGGVTDMEVLDPDQATPAEAQVAFDVEQRIKHNITAMRTLWVKLAEDLYRFHELDMWKDLGYQSFEQWLAGPDVDLARRTVFGLIEVWRELVVHRNVKPHEIADVPISKLRDALPAVRRGFIEAPDAIADCRTLGRDDLRERYAQLSTPAGARRESAGTLPSPGQTALDDGGDPPAGARSSNITRQEGTNGQPVPVGASFDARDEPEHAICPTCGSRYRVAR